ncbi:AEC family transporter [Sulfurimonas sp.]|uniref:AEC family transporter n=1 Tax=Sulfurimonas sp. TaxID=2022749 RepID=UPI003D10E4BB
MSNFILIFIYIGLGYFFKSTSFYSQKIPNILNKLVIYISLPAMILLQIPKLQLLGENIFPIIIAWSVMAVSALMVLIISKYFHFSKEIEGILLLVTPLGNTSFLGIPIIQSYYGDEALPYVLIYDQFGTFLALATYGTFVLSIYSNKTKVSATIILKKLFTFPPFIFLLVAFTLSGIKYIPVVQSILNILSSTIVPFALIAVGLQLHLKLPAKDLRPLSSALIIKLIFAPIFAMILCNLFNFQGEIAKISIMEAGMAPMITAGAMATLAGFNPRLVSAIIGYGILLSFLSTYLLHTIII